MTDCESACRLWKRLRWTLWYGVLLPLLELVNLILPKRRQALLCSFPDLDDQAIALLRAWPHTTAGQQRRLVVLLHRQPASADFLAKARSLIGLSADTLRFLPKFSLAGIWAYWRSDLLFFTHNLFGDPRLPRRQFAVNLWHGMPIKRIWMPGAGLWRKGRELPPPPCSILLSTSAHYTSLLSSISGLPPEKIPSLGLPRNDLLFSQTEATARFSRMLRTKAQRILFLLPTYRRPKSAEGEDYVDGIQHQHVLMMSPGEINRLEMLLRSMHALLLVKPHPHSVHYGPTRTDDSLIWQVNDDWFWQQGLTLYEALGQSDALITDISSVYIDYLALRRPVFFYFPDQARYRESREFLLTPLTDWLAGPLCETADALLDELRLWKERDSYEQKRHHLASLLNPQSAPVAASRLLEYLSIHAP